MRLRVSSLPLAIAAMAIAPVAFAAEPFTIGEYGSFSVDAIVMHDATPDIINLNVSCDMQDPVSRAEMRDLLKEKQKQIASLVGSDGQVRRSGSPVVYPFYEAPPFDPSGRDIMPSKPLVQRFTGNFSLVVRSVKKEASLRISDAIEDMGCGVNWDVRLMRTGQYARQHRAELMEQIEEKKAFFEDLLGKKLTQVSSMSTYTSVDYGYYGGSSMLDPETLTVPATTSLNMSFEFGTGDHDGAERR